MQLGMDGVKGKAKSFTTDLSRMSAISIGLANNLIGIGIEGAAAMLNLAKGSPAAASSMASFGIALQQLGFSLGRSLLPIIEGSTAAFEGFVGFMQDNEDTFYAISTAITEVVGASWELVTVLGALAGMPLGIGGLAQGFSTAEVGVVGQGAKATISDPSIAKGDEVFAEFSAIHGEPSGKGPEPQVIILRDGDGGRTKFTLTSVNSTIFE